MALVSKNIPNLINGVSQQPSALRLASQGEVQENGFSDIVDGLKKRPPTEFKNVLRKGSPTGTALSSTELGRSYFHTYKRSDTEQFTVVYDPVDTKMRVYDIDGNLRYESGVGSWRADGSWITSNSNSTSYLHSITKDDIASTSVADYTFFVNKKKVVAKNTSTPSNSRPYEGMFYLKKSDYGKVYRAGVLGHNGGFFATHDGATAPQALGLATGMIMDAISGRNTNVSSTYAASHGAMTIPAGFSRGGSSFQPYFTLYSNSTNFSLAGADDQGGTSLFTHKDAVATFTELPKYCTNGFTIQVNGDNQKKEDDFYVRFTGDETSGTWKECPAPSRPSNPVYHSFDTSTMPHTLRQNMLMILLPLVLKHGRTEKQGMMILTLSLVL